MQKHTEDGSPLCGDCHDVIADGELYVVVHKREPVDADSSVMVHLHHFRSTRDFVDAAPVEAR